VIRKLFSVLIFALAVAGAPPFAARSASAQGRPARPGPEVPADAREAIDRGTAYLVRSQLRSGAWNGEAYTVPVTALAGLALLASGSTPTTGPHADSVRRAAEYLLKSQLRSGLFYPQGMIDDRPMYGHGFTLLFLSECFGMSGDFLAERRVAKAIERAVEVTSQAQSPDGGWYYTAESREDEGSVTITQIQGLRAARNAGFRVKREVIDRALSYMRRSQDPDGGVRYTLRYGKSTLALTAAGLACFFGAGDYASENVQKALTYVRRNMDMSDDGHFHYTHFYLAQAMHQQGGHDWEGYFPRIRAELVRTRRSDGSWMSSYGSAYATALSLLILEIPYRYLPIYER